MKTIDYVNESIDEISADDLTFIKNYPNTYYRKEDNLGNFKRQLEIAINERFDESIIKLIETKIDDIQKMLDEARKLLKKINNKYGEEIVNKLIDKYDRYSY